MSSNHSKGEDRQKITDISYQVFLCFYTALILELHNCLKKWEIEEV
jgi:hypothetical protein